MTSPLRIAQVAPPLERVPPQAYGGTERVIHELVNQLVARGHEVTTFASGDSEVPGRHVVTAPQALRPAGFGGDASGWFVSTVLAALEAAGDFDVIHSHVEWYSPLLSLASPVPVVTTFHGRLDFPWAADVLRRGGGNYVAVSRAQAATHPDVPWMGVVYNGLSLAEAPFEPRRADSLCFVGRVAPEKGIVEAIEIARRSGRPLRIAAKIGTTPHERAYYEDVFTPALAAAGTAVEFLGELEQGDRDRLIAGSYASLMPGSWPEPFGLVAIESLACGTPVLARRVGALPEIVRDGVDGFFGDDVRQLASVVDRVGGLDRAAIRASVLERFSAQRMADGYEAIYRRLVDGIDPARGAELREATRSTSGVEVAPLLPRRGAS
ncbi:MAG: glycosyltransferase family 4 protein [Chloroflexota bacterium]|nr:glycosyltransferase family 4 protein [Chloroflexota bacterium]